MPNVPVAFLVVTIATIKSPAAALPGIVVLIEPEASDPPSAGFELLAT